MLRNYFIIALRHLSRNKVFSLINLAGLSIGLATFLVIFTFVSFHRGFDTYHADADRIVRVGTRIKLGGEVIISPTVGAPAAKAFKEELPGIDEIATIFSRPYFRFNISVGDKSFPSEQGVYADSLFFSMFSIPVVAGNPSTALTEPKSIVLTESMVKKYFGDQASPESVIGELVEIEDQAVVRVTAVCADVPQQTHFTFNVLISSDLNPRDRQYWLGEGVFTYVKLAKGQTAEQLHDIFPALTEKYIGPEIKEFLGVNLSEFLATGGEFEFTTTPIEDIHLKSHAETEIAVNANGTYVNIFFGVGVLILLLAVINFINLSAASNIQRLKEVGVRKVMGARREGLVLQFMTEAILITVVAFGLALTLQQGVTPLVGQYFGVNMGDGVVSVGWYVSVALAGSIVIGAAAGIYPAFLLSNAKTINALKGQTSVSSKKSSTRNALMVVQFAITIGLLSCVMVIMAQVHYLQTKPLGYNKDQVMLINSIDHLSASRSAVRQELEALPGVEAVSIASYVPSGPSDFDRNAMQDLTAEAPETFRVTHAAVDEHFLEAMQMKLLYGRNFSEAYGDESSNVIINAAMSRAFGWDVATGEAIGKTVTDVDFNRGFTVIGIVDDFHVFNMQDPITPFFFRYSKEGFVAVIRFNTNELPALNAAFPDMWKQFSEKPANKSYLNEFFLKTFEEEKKIGSLFEMFTALAVILSGMGLFAMTAFNTHQRTKEIGIRKVLGAEGFGLFIMLSKGVVFMLLIAAVICIPMVYYGMSEWLQSYPYRIALPIWALVAPLAGIVLFALSVSGWHILKVIRINPVESLRDE
ncbi:MAG: ABC transporter permease [Imperialibacter sp.]|uniref:ABC transporter permease n=1 Tax=Imperialibacter sp. TaxID=2038411 RepID=UPI0032EAEE9E